jgi:cell division transport system permease protein
MGKLRPAKTTAGLRVVYFTSVVSITLVMTVLGLLGLSWLGAGQLVRLAQSQFSLQIVLANLVTPSDAGLLLKGLQEQPWVASASYISQEQATQEYMTAYGDDFLDVLDENPLPALIELRVPPTHMHTDSIAEITQRLLTGWPLQFISVEGDVQGIRGMNANVQTLTYVLLGLLGVLGFIMVALINHLIRLSLYSRRFIIKTMQLVGASPSFIRRPFLRTGLWHGFLGGLIASALLCVLLWFFHQEFSEILPQTQLGFVFALSGILPLAAMLVSWLSTRWAVGRFLRQKIEDLY